MAICFPGIASSVKRPYLSSANSAVAHDEILNRHQCDKNHKADDIVAAYDKLSESFNDTSGGEFLISMKQDSLVAARSSDSLMSVKTK